MLSQLSGSDQRTNDCISRPPPLHKSAWWDVRSMPSSTDKTAREPQGNVKVTRDEQPSVLDVSLDTPR